MKRSERGFTLIELLLVLAIVALIAGGAGAATLQLFASTKLSNDHMTAVRQVQNAGYWLSQDIQTAETAVVDNQTPASFIVLAWTEWGYNNNSTYHSVTYSVEDLSGGFGKLKRNHWSSAGANEQTLVAEYIYFDPGEPDTTEATYAGPVLTVQIAASFGEASEIKEYQIQHRREF